eukprot:scaffold378434_cov35-Attheya_sp.AAC.1
MLELVMLKPSSVLYKQYDTTPVSYIQLITINNATSKGGGGMSPADTADHMMKLYNPPSAAAITSFT